MENEPNQVWQRTRLHVSEVAAGVSPGLPLVPALLYIFITESELNYSGLVAPVLIMLSVS